jgi:hypothetical protein
VDGPDRAELVLDDQVLVFDGEVLEHFVRHLDDGARIHVRFLAVHGEEPDRRGRTRYHFTPGPDKAGGVRISVPPERQADLDALLDAIGRARRRLGLTG